MLIEEIKTIKRNEKEWRKFGLTVGIALGLLGALVWWRGKSFYPYFLFIAAALILLGLIAPKVLNPIHRVWMTLALLIGWVMTRVLLSILFFGVLTPLGFLARLFGKDFLDQKFRDHKESYWIKRNRLHFEKSNYEKQF